MKKLEENAAANFLYLHMPSLFTDLTPALEPKALEISNLSCIEEFKALNPNVQHEQVLTRCIARQMKTNVYLGRLLISARQTSFFINPSFGQSRPLLEYEKADIERRYRNAKVEDQLVAMEILQRYTAATND